MDTTKRLKETRTEMPPSKKKKKLPRNENKVPLKKHNKMLSRNQDKMSPTKLMANKKRETKCPFFKYPSLSGPQQELDLEVLIK